MDRALMLAGRLLPVLGIVVLVIFLSNLLLQGEWVRENLGVQSGPRGWFLAVVGGVLAAGPVYPCYALFGYLILLSIPAGVVLEWLLDKRAPLLQRCGAADRGTARCSSSARFWDSPRAGRRMIQALSG